MVCIQRIGILCFFLMFGVGFLVEAVPINKTNGLGFKLLLAKLEYMEYKFLELQVEVKEQGEQLLSSQEKIKQDLLEQSRQILEQQKFFANHKALKQSIFELRPRKHPSDNSCSGRYRMNVTESDPFRGATSISHYRQLARSQHKLSTSAPEQKGNVNFGSSTKEQLFVTEPKQSNCAL